MKEFILANISFALSTAIVLYINYSGISTPLLLQLTVLAIVVVFLGFDLVYMKFGKHEVNTAIRWLLLFILAVLVQLFIATTGGFFSPFLSLVHLFTLGITLLFRFRIAIIFLFYSVIGIFLGMWILSSSFDYIINDPVLFLVLLITFIAIAPVSKALSDTYHLKDSLLNILSKQVKVEEALLAEVSELIFITNKDMKILSLNDSVERVLRKSRSELYQKELFDVVFLRDQNGSIIKKDAPLFSDVLEKGNAVTLPHLTLLATPQATRSVKMQIKPLVGLEGKVEQISFIISQEHILSSLTILQYIDESRLRLQAMSEELKMKLLEKGEYDMSSRLRLISKMSEDVLIAYQISEKNVPISPVLIDAATLTKQTVQLEQEFASALKVSLECRIDISRAADALPIVRNDTGTQEIEETGPFFTVLSDPKYLGLLLAKSIELALLLASGVEQSKTIVMVQQDQAAVNIIIDGTDQAISQELMNDIFKPHYGALSDRPRFQLGSGFEGYLVLEFARMLGIHFQALQISRDNFRFITTLQKS